MSKPYSLSNLKPRGFRFDNEYDFDYEYDFLVQPNSWQQFQNRSRVKSCAGRLSIYYKNCWGSWSQHYDFNKLRSQTRTPSEVERFSNLVEVQTRMMESEMETEKLANHKVLFQSLDGNSWQRNMGLGINLCFRRVSSHLGISCSCFRFRFRLHFRLCFRHSRRYCESGLALSAPKHNINVLLNPPKLSL